MSSNQSFIAIGSNIGDRVANVQTALKMMQSSLGIDFIESTGFLYESAPMYLTDQPAFLNTCCKIRTSLSPRDLLKCLKHIEDEMGRLKTIRNGPRCIDLDIIFYSDQIVDEPDLIIPHPRFHERFFVIAPLHDIEPTFKHSLYKRSIAEIYSKLERSQGDSCKRVFPAMTDSALFKLGSKSFIVGILNVTPDSFSDGGLYITVDDAVGHAREMIDSGADIIDIGGESTRPHATVVDAEEEQERVIGVIKRIREEFPHVPISIDTYRASTAKKAVEAGASIVNDVSCGLLDVDMLATVAELNVPYILTHAGRVGSHNSLDYGDGMPSVFDDDEGLESAISTIHNQLNSRVNKCIRAGIFRWNVIIDPGLGFGKSGEVNFEIIKSLHKLLVDGLLVFPTMIGASRKRFVRDLVEGKSWAGTNEDALMGTAAVTVAAIASCIRVDFHRVHDVKQIKQLLVVSDKIYR